MSKVALRYAKAIFSLAEDQKKTKDIFIDMKHILSTLQNSKELTSVIESPLVTVDKKVSILDNVFHNSTTLTKQLFKLLVENKRSSSLLSVAESYISLYNSAHDLQEATVTTVFPLNDSLKERIQKIVVKLTGSKASIKNTIDDSIIGGFILRVGDLQYNASIAHKLTTLRRELSN